MMADAAEKSNFERNTSVDRPSAGAYYRVVVDLGDRPDEIQQRIMSVAKKIVSEDRSRWPSDDEWRKDLPASFQEAFPRLTKEEYERLLQNVPKERWGELPWDFGSWLDAIRVRGWRWQAHQRVNQRLTILLRIAETPIHIEAFEQLLKAAGGHIISSTQA